MKSFVLITATVGLLSSVPLVDAAQKPTTAPFDPICAEVKGLAFGAYWEFLKQHPQCRKEAPPSTSSLSSGGGGKSFDYTQVPSDRRLKCRIELVDVLHNGLRLYAYSYLGDARTFVGVMAQDLLTDERFADALVVDGDGFYAVDYAALGLDVVAVDAMRKAGRYAAGIARGIS